MHAATSNYYPLSAPFLLLLVLLIGVIIALVEFQILAYAYEKIGISRRYIFLLLMVSLLGAYVNIPVAELRPRAVVEERTVTFFGVTYIIPEVAQQRGTILAVNLGGAILPTCLSLYLMLRNGIYWRSVLGIAIVAAIVHALAYPVPGLGIATPTFVPPVAAAMVGFLLSRRYAPAVAYIAGSVGTLFGADLLNLDKIQGLGAPVASIGGAGTFDGIFLSGIVAVLLTRRGAAADETPAAPATTTEGQSFAV
jgi:uncharacterized membrane protein